MKYQVKKMSDRMSKPSEIMATTETDSELIIHSQISYNNKIENHDIAISYTDIIMPSTLVSLVMPDTSEQIFEIIKLKSPNYPNK